MKSLTIFFTVFMISFVHGQQIKPCSTQEYRQFDFWIGEWTVYNPKGMIAGESSVQSINDSCTILENWNGNGSKGRSFNLYNLVTKKWEQTWVDNQGNKIFFEGGLVNKVMDLRSTSTDSKGTQIISRMQFTKISENEVRQLWDQSTDQGKSWTILFDGKYVRKPKP